MAGSSNRPKEAFVGKGANDDALVSSEPATART
jgi:hypothetical protein